MLCTRGGTHWWMPVKYDLISREQLIDLLKWKILGLRVEEPDEWDKKEVEDCEVDVCPPSNAIDAHWSNLNYKEGKNP